MPDLGNLFVVPETTAPVTTVATTAAPTEETIPCDSLKLDDTDVMLTFVGDSWKIVATMEPADTTDVLQFFSSDESVATVSSGTVTGVAAGECEIIARVAATGAVAKCAVTVTGT
jgi:uncharacterized protein YjdB